MGPAARAYITVDRLGAPRSAGGISVTLRDVAPVGRPIASGGNRGGASVTRWTLLFGLGIHGRYLLVDAERQPVIAKVSSHDLPLDAALIASTLRALSAVPPALVG
jgi:hypothetical protein